MPGTEEEGHEIKQVRPADLGLLLDAQLPEIIWATQLVAAALAATGLLALKSRQQSALSNQQEQKDEGQWLKEAISYQRSAQQKADG